jgi:hypothetical protein
VIGPRPNPTLFAAVLAVVSANASAADDKSVEALYAQDRVPLAFLLNTPTGEVAKASSSDIIRIVSDYLKEHTNFSLQVNDTNIATECKGRVTCLVLQVRTDYNRMALLKDEGGVIPYSEYLAELARKKQPHPRYLLVLSNVTVEGHADRLSALLIDTDIALDRFHSAPRQGDWEREVESRINESAVVAGPTRGEVKSPDEARRFLENLISQELSRPFEETKNWEPYGSIELATPHAGVSISLDGVSIGTTHAGKTTVARVTPGTRKLTLEHPDFRLYTSEVNVERQKAATVEVDLVRSGSSGGAIARKVTIWSGAALGAAGIGFIVFAIARQHPDLMTGCFKDAASSCRTAAQFQTFGYDPSKTTGQVNPAGLMAAPLGYSLVGTGVIWSLGTLFFGDDAEIPWLQLGVGLAFGLASYGVSAVLNGATPSSR